MEEKLLELISSEDKKNPLSDNEIADKLSISRYDVIKLRKKLNIQDYSSRRLPSLSKTIIDLINNNNEISNVELTRQVEEQGYNVSRFLVAKLRDELANKIEKKEKQILANKEPDLSRSLLDGLVGHNGSIKYQINQAIAAVKYPPHGLHTLIFGQTGTGKSYLAEIMFQIAKESGRIDPNTRLIKLNCADYANNPQLLLSQLFGYVKGAFTGAESSKNGLIEKAHNGILFLDEIHRLPFEGQEILFSVMDNGTYRKLGQSDQEEKVNVMIVAATTEDIDSHLLGTFRRRIPMMIELPPLSKRPIDEKYEIVVNFLRNEALRIGTKIYMKSEALCALLLYDCVGNIGQLKSDIQVSCARAYLKYLNDGDECITIDISDFNVYVQKNLLRNKYSNEEINKYLYKGIIIDPDDTVINILEDPDTLLIPENIYMFIDERLEFLKRNGIPEELVNDIVAKELDIKFEKVIKHINKNLNNTYERKDIVKLVGEDITKTVEIMIEIGEKALGPLNKSLIYCLSMHLYESVKRIRENKSIVNPELSRIRSSNILEYSVARDMIESAATMLNASFPEDEIGFITMYLKANREYLSKFKARVKIVVITHGSVAVEISKFVNNTLNDESVYAICMPMDESPEVTLKRTVDLVKNINERGVLLLVDMGSLLTFGEIITRETGIPTRTVARVDQVMVLDAAIKAKEGGISLEMLYNTIENQDKVILRMPKENSPSKSKAIITMCITGNGAAVTIRKIIMDSLSDLAARDVEIIPVGIIGNKADEYIKKIQLEKDVVAIVGTIDPGIDSLKFFPIEELMQNQGIKELEDLILNTKKNGSESKPDKVFYRELIINADYQSKNQTIETLGGLLFKNGFVKESYLTDLIIRESLISTGFINGIAIPHTYPKHVKRPAIAIAVLNKPVKWSEDYYADIIMMLALGYQNSAVLKNLYNVANDIELLNEIRRYENPDKLIDILSRKLFM